MTFVSVIIPTYNYANFISEAIESVLNQSYPRELIEIIVIDDGSTDYTRAILEGYILKKQIRYYYQENKGKASATSFGIKKSIGSIIFNLDADDYYLFRKIEHTVDIFNSDSNIVHVATPAIYFKEGKEVGIEAIPKNIIGVSTDGNEVLNLFYNQNILFGGGSTYAARATVLKRLSISDDVDMYIDELLILGVLPFGKTYFIEKPLSIWRIHKLNYSGNIRTEIEKKVKQNRLLKSSFSTLNYLINNSDNYSFKLIKIYKLKHFTRVMNLKQQNGKKNVSSICKYFWEVLKLRLGFKVLSKYFFFNMLIPTYVYIYIKKWLK